MPSRRAYRMARARVLRQVVVPVREVAMMVPSPFLVSVCARALACACVALCRVGRAWAARRGTRALQVPLRALQGPATRW